MLTATEYHIDNLPGVTCAILAEEIDEQALLTKLKSEYEIELYDDFYGYQRTRIYEIASNVRALFYFSFATPDEPGLGNFQLSVVFVPGSGLVR